MRTTAVVIALTLLAALSMARQWGGPIYWETDALFYQATKEEILGKDASAARTSVFEGPLSNYERHLEAAAPDEPARVSNPAWPAYSARFYARRLFLPALAAALNPVLGLHALETLSLLGFVLVPPLLFLLLRRRFSLAASVAVAGAVIVWPPLREWSVFPLADSCALALLIAGLLCALSVTERSPRWLIPWVLCVSALSFTHDTAFILVIAAFSLALVRRDRRSWALTGSGLLASLPALFVHSPSVSEAFAYVFAHHTIPTDTSWSAVIPKYLPNLSLMAHRYLDYAIANPHVVVLAIGGIVAAFAFAPRRDPLTVLVWATLIGYAVLLAIGPTFSNFRYELVLLPLIALGYGHLAQRIVERVVELKTNRGLAGDAVGP